MEIKPLRRKLLLQKTVVESLAVYSGSLSDRRVVAVVTGIGSVLAADKVERLLKAFDIDQVVVVGITGALDSDTPIGALVLPVIVVNGATGSEYRPKQLGGGNPRGKMWTSDEFVTDREVIARLRANGVNSLDMETAAVAEICEHRKIPWSVYRAVSDHATDDSVDGDVFNLINRDGTYNIRLIGAFIVKHPRRVPALARLAKDAKLAAENAAAAAVDAVLLSSGQGPFSRDP